VNSRCGSSAAWEASCVNSCLASAVVCRIVIGRRLVATLPAAMTGRPIFHTQRIRPHRWQAI
jgi:hypothetical protein